MTEPTDRDGETRDRHHRNAHTLSFRVWSPADHEAARVRITTDTGQVLVHGTFALEWETWEPNGPGCGTCRAADVQWGPLPATPPATSGTP